MDSFETLVEASVGDFMKKALDSAKEKIDFGAKQLGNAALGMVSSTAEGKYDLGRVTGELSKKYKYYLSTQKKTPTVDSYVEFVNVTTGAKIDAVALYAAMHGFNPEKSTKPPVMNAPNKAEMDSLLKVITNPRSKEDRVKAAAEMLERFANKPANENYLVLFIKWMKFHHPAALKRAGTNPLLQFSHGGQLRNDQVMELLEDLAGMLIKAKMEQMRDEQKNAAEGGKPAADGEGEDENSESKDAPQPSTANEISVNPPSTMQLDNWGGLKLPQQPRKLLTSQQMNSNLLRIGLNTVPPWENWARREYSYPPEAVNTAWVEYRNRWSNIGYQPLNAMTAQLMARIPEYPMDQFIDAIMEVQTNSGLGIFWQRTNVIAAVRFAVKGGPFDEITAELNYFANNKERASLLFVAVMRFITRQFARVSTEVQPEEATSKDEQSTKAAGAAESGAAS